MIQDIQRRGLMLVLSSPSGAGKTTLSRMLLERDGNVFMSVSATTRKPRPGEEDGKDYFFMSHERFAEMVTEGALLEHAEVFGNYYGTPSKPVNQSLSEGKDVLFDIDWQGTQQLNDSVAQDLVKVFILPPSVTDLEERLRGRGQDSDEVVKNRMAQAESEISHWAEYDYVLINKDREETYEQLCTILKAERLKRKRKPGLTSFVQSLKYVG